MQDFETFAFENYPGKLPIVTIFIENLLNGIVQSIRLKWFFNSYSQELHRYSAIIVVMLMYLWKNVALFWCVKCQGLFPLIVLIHLSFC